MSRHIIQNKVTGDVIVGWDNPLNTFFCQIFDCDAYDEDEELILQIGQSFSEYCDIEKFKKELEKHNIILTEEMIEILENDRETARPRTPLQDLINKAFN